MLKASVAPGDLSDWLIKQGRQFISAAEEARVVDVEPESGPASLERLDLLIDFRNAATHGNLSEAAALESNGKIKPTLQSFRDFRASVNRLVRILDEAVADALASTLKAPPPW